MKESRVNKDETTKGLFDNKKRSHGKQETCQFFELYSETKLND